MKALDFLPPAKSSALSAEKQTPEFHASQAKSSEPFDALMSRALARPAPEPGENSYAAKKTASDSRAGRAPKNDAGILRKSKPSNHPRASPADTSHSSAAEDPSVRGSAKEKHGGASADEGLDANPVEDNHPASAPGADAASGDAAAALQALAASEAVPINLTASAAIGAGKIAGTGAGNNPGTTSATAPVLIPKTAGAAPESAKGVAEKMSQPGAKEAAGGRQEVAAAAGNPAKKTDSASGAAPIQALLDQAEISKKPPAIATNSASDKPPSAVPEAAGISAAQQTATMKTTDNAPKIAGDPEQSLPGVTVVAAAPSPVREKTAAKAVARVEPSETTVTANVSAVDRTPATAETPSNNLTSASVPTELSVRTLDRTHELMALHGLRLKDSNANSLHVVLKPGGGIELSLQLKQIGDGIEAQAVLQRGDFNQLNQHWTELQQRLEERGITLAPLGHENFTAGNGHENSQRHFTNEDRGWKLEDSSPNLQLPSSILDPRRQPLPLRGWESWA